MANADKLRGNAGRGSARRGGAGRGAAAPCSRRWREWAPLMALGGLILAGFGPVFWAGFVWDDSVFLLEARPVREWGGLLDIWFNPASMAEGHYWPLVYTAFWLEHKLWGFNPLGFHAVNLLLHWLNTALLLRLLQRLAVPGAWLAAAVFAVHPAHAEPVAWVISRKDLLASLFYLLAAGCWLRYRSRPTARAYLALLGLFVAGMLSKSFVVTLPAMLLVAAWWRHGRIVKTDVLQTMPLFLIGAFIAIGDLIFYFERAVLHFDYSFAERLIIAGKALWFYAGKLLWPQPLPVIYPKWDVDPGQLLNWLPLLLAAALAIGLHLARGRIGRGPLAGALFFAITLSPVLGFANNSYMGISFVADRYQYLASAGILTVLAAGAAMLYRRLEAAARRGAFADAAAGRNGAATFADGRDGAELRAAWLHDAIRCAAAILAAALLAIYGALSFQQAQAYRDPLIFFNHIRTHNPGEYHGHYNYGLALMERKRYEEAEAPTRRAIEIAPESSAAHQNLAVITHNLGRHDETLAALKQATELAGKQTAEQYYHIGHVAAQVERYDEAERFLLRALAMEPGHREAEDTLVFAYLDAGRYADALALRPGIGAALQRIAGAQIKEGRFEDAAGNYRRAAAIEPENAQVRANLNYALSQLAVENFTERRFQKALELFREITALDPGNAEAHSNLGSALAQLGRFREALASFERALAIDPQLESAGYNRRLALEKLRAQPENGAPPPSKPAPEQ